MPGFSFRERRDAIDRMRKSYFDVLVVGGGITGAAVARDAVSRGLSTALIERKDFSFGTSSRSSKLIHGGLRYLENFEFGLVFEALSERAHLLKTCPHMVKPLPFYFPIYKGDSHSSWLVSAGLWLYDTLALFRSPGRHQRLSKKKLLQSIPFLNANELEGGFYYYDASMWDDVLAVETLRSAKEWGAAVANYVSAEEPIWEGDHIVGYRAKDQETGEEITIRSKSVVICAGPWTDLVGEKLGSQWREHLQPSKGVHLVFDIRKIPISGAMVMTHPEDGRVAFVIPRLDFGSGVVIVGTTDGPAPAHPDEPGIDSSDVDYLMSLLQRYFPDLDLQKSDIIGGYSGIRPLFKTDEKASLQKVSREHHIETGPGGVVLVMGGKYTTHRNMAEEIVSYLLKNWPQHGEKPPGALSASKTYIPVNPLALEEEVTRAQSQAEEEGFQVPRQLINRYGAEALDIVRLHREKGRKGNPDPEGFPMLEAQLRFSIREEMVLHLEDFFLRRMPLALSRKDHGMEWSRPLAEVWAEELGRSEAQKEEELERLDLELKRRFNFMEKL